MKKVTNSSSTRGAGRTRNYATIIYPGDSAPDNWQELLAEAKIPMFISPLHDKDVNPDGTPKKPHRHVMVMYDSVKTKEQAEMFFKTVNGVGLEVVNSIRGYARYLCHLDNPEKYQYSIDEVISYGGADYINAIGTYADKEKACREMMNFIEENDITCFSDLSLYASINRSAWFSALVNNSSYFIKEYIKSRTWKLHHEEEK